MPFRCTELVIVYICSPARVHRNSGSETEAWPSANQRQDRPIWGWGDCQSVSRWHNSSAGLYTSLCDTRDEVIKYDNIYSRFQSEKSYPRNTEQQATLIWWTWWIRKYIKLLLYFVKKQLVQQSVKFCFNFTNYNFKLDINQYLYNNFKLDLESMV